MSAHIRRPGVSPRVLLCTLLTAALTYACGGGGSDTPTQPEKPAVDRTPIKVVAGTGQTDTIGATLPQAIVVEVRDTSGKLFTGATVRFTSIGGTGMLLVSPIGAQAFAAFASDVADAQGRAKALLQLGASASTVKLEIAVPELGAADTIGFVVKPGLPAKFTIAPRDTTIQPGTSYTLRVQTTDRASNPVPSVVPTYSATGVSVTPAGLVTAASAAARASIVVTYQGLSDSASVSVVPKLPVVMTRNGAGGREVVLMNTDGTGAKTLFTSSDQSLSPTAVTANPNVLFYQGDPGYSGTIWVVSKAGGTAQRLLPSATRPEGWARLSPDGAWVYFMRDYKSLWRVKVDGTGLDSLTTFSQQRVFIAPTVSSDGHSVALEDGTGVQIYDVNTRTPRTMSVTCGFPTYSPDGTYFSCKSGATVSVVKTDGTGQRIVANLAQYAPLDDLSGVDWTPDGKWLLVTTWSGALLVEVSTGSVLPLTGMGGGFIQVSFVR